MYKSIAYWPVLQARRGSPKIRYEHVQASVGSIDPIPITIESVASTNANQPDIRRHMDLARGTYSSVHVLVSACLVPSAMLNKF